MTEDQKTRIINALKGLDAAVGDVEQALENAVEDCQ